MRGDFVGPSYALDTITETGVNKKLYQQVSLSSCRFRSNKPLCSETHLIAMQLSVRCFLVTFYGFMKQHITAGLEGLYTLHQESVSNHSASRMNMVQVGVSALVAGQTITHNLTSRSNAS